MLFGNKMDKIEKLAQKGQEEKLVEFLKDKKEDVRLAAIDALGKCTGDVAFNALVPLVHNEDPAVRIRTAAALSNMKQPRARTFLEHQREIEKDASVLKAIEEALAKISDVVK